MYREYLNKILVFSFSISSDLQLLHFLRAFVPCAINGGGYSEGAAYHGADANEKARKRLAA